MITHLQIQNFIKDNMDSTIHKNLIKDFDNYCLKNNKISENPLTIEFHENIKFDESKTQSLLLFNEYVYNDIRLVKLFSNIYNCNKYFLEYLFNEKNKDIIDYFNMNSQQILNYISYKNYTLYQELLTITFDLNDKKLYPYLSYIEEYIIIYHQSLYFSDIVNLKKVYFSFIDYLEKIFKKDSNFELDSYFLENLKKNDIIINKYMNSLFFDNELSDLFESFNDYNNNLMIFLSMKTKYFKSFLNDYHLDFDLNIYTNYNNCELYHNNNIKYFFY